MGLFNVKKVIALLYGIVLLHCSLGICSATTKATRNHGKERRTIYTTYWPRPGHVWHNTDSVKHARRRVLWCPNSASLRKPTPTGSDTVAALPTAPTARTVTSIG